jgi:hypothetical protein
MFHERMGKGVSPLLSLACLLLFLVWVPALQASVTNLTAVALNPNPPSPNTPITLVVNYCADPWNQSSFLVEVNNLGWTTIPQWHIPIVGQYFLVDKNGINQSDYVADDFNNGGGPAGWYMNDNGRACGPVTFVNLIPARPMAARTISSSTR